LFLLGHQEAQLNNPKSLALSPYIRLFVGDIYK